MSFSMTGYGQSSRHLGGSKIVFEVKSVNHRYCEIVVRMPREWNGFEDALRRKVQQYVKRGRIDVFINREHEENAGGPVLNRPVVKAYLAAAEALKKEFGVGGELDLPTIMSLPGVLESGDGSPDLPENGEFLQELLVGGLEESVRALVEMRAREGRYLAADIAERLSRLEELLSEMTGLAPAVVLEYRDKLRQRLAELQDGTFPFDDQKFGMEVAVFADRSNIEEELTRLRSHFEQCRNLLGSGEPMGRKLDFLIQEMNRETNTIGSKCNHLGIAGRVLEMKAELEKIREQAANLE
ncbi:YicC/YloC family endoribonuclease [Paenibacillus apii]|uniref:YicC/YloC family endoribonuclease n=1 Tax=Paenibacillus apii TaxID=1850370 RepID=UPI00143B7AE6|nr:YicC/YloC family endoribonuclease [Paenibacillus apii]NJJ38963.1 YicC family protein [Paenibacillus apii]